MAGLDDATAYHRWKNRFWSFALRARRFEVPTDSREGGMVDGHLGRVVVFRTMDIRTSPRRSQT